MSVLKHLKSRLHKTRYNFVGRLEDLFNVGGVDEDFYEGLEELLISGDVGIRATMEICNRLRDKAKEKRIRKREELNFFLQELLVENLSTESLNLPELPVSGKTLSVILIVGVNGSGKTTTIGKMAYRFKQEGRRVILVAGDTFRAAAIEQLEIWADRAGADLIKHQPGADPSAVFYDAISAAKARGADVIIGDTAGRLHTKVNLMAELKKIHRVIHKVLPGAPDEVLLVMDAITGQNGVIQAKLFQQSVPLTGIVLTKLDGTAKGGIIISVKNELNLPVKLIGVGEKIEDLQLFDPQLFIKALFTQ